VTDRLAGRTALITAAGAGIGRACALAFAANGARVLATDIDARALARLAEAAPGIATAVLDVTDADAVRHTAALMRMSQSESCAAGIVPGGSILDCDRASWDQALSLNLTAMYEVVRAVLPNMLANRRGSIVTIASVASSVRGVPNRFAYGATKAGVIGLTKAVAADFVGHGIRANAICPGTIDTPSLEGRMAASGDVEAARAAFVARQPIGRLGTAQEVAALALYLASDEAAFTTGAIHVIDGGWTN
jgi:2-keto-3-deoxy-L-fuconate dehydrogenase